MFKDGSIFDQRARITASQSSVGHLACKDSGYIREPQVWLYQRKFSDFCSDIIAYCHRFFTPINGVSLHKNLAGVCTRKREIF